jgi:hypothetical protein
VYDFVNGYYPIFLLNIMARALFEIPRGVVLKKI